MCLIRKYQRFIKNFLFVWYYLLKKVDFFLYLPGSCRGLSFGTWEDLKKSKFLSISEKGMRRVLDFVDYNKILSIWATWSIILEQKTSLFLV